MRVSDFHFDLPEELIAQHPLAERGASRMLVMRRGGGGGASGAEEPALRDAMFADFSGQLEPGDLLVLNDSRVMPARLFGRRVGVGTARVGGAVEALLVEEMDAAEGGGLVWRALVKPGRKVRVGDGLEFFASGAGAGGEGEERPVLTAEVVGAGEFGERTLRFGAVEDFWAALERVGHMPLPPYIRRQQAGGADAAEDRKEDRERYQTVYARQAGSAAAPTAGLHFTPEILEAVRARGVEIATVTLHVGLGTFQPVRVSELADIRLHSERYTVPAATAEALNRARREGRRVIAVGTTTTRVLEHVAMEAEARGGAAAGRDLFAAHSGSTAIFLGPGHRFRVVDGLLTNFHLPESTLLMLAAAFAGAGDEGRRAVLVAYAHAVREGYRFYSYGDCMLLV
jgi:S-adenosylmethionine:tRNA ribosyltransferase-isomerase